ncbi:MAG: PhzF family phenazine biosynthesis protein [Pseudomonadota bacterium]
MTAYLVYDVFTDRPFGGNPLAVIPDARALPEEALQKIAREFNFSETTFVYPPEDPAHTAKVRIFTPTAELPFAGHPTIGTATALFDLGRGGPEMVLELGVGPIPCQVGDDGARFETRVPLTREKEFAAETVADCLGLGAAQIVTDRHPPVLAGVGLAFLLVEIRDRASLAACQSDIRMMRSVAWTIGGKPRASVFAYFRDGNTIHARMFSPLSGIPEDPATGSASAGLTALLGELAGKDMRFDIHQGDDMGRPSRIRSEVSVVDGKAVAVAIAGQAVRVMEGALTI